MYVYGFGRCLCIRVKNRNTTTHALKSFEKIERKFVKNQG